MDLEESFSERRNIKPGVNIEHKLEYLHQSKYHEHGDELDEDDARS